MTKSVDLNASPVAPRGIWLAILIFLDLGWMYFDRSAYHPENMTISYPNILAGTGCAPEQFRIGILVFAQFLHSHSRFSLQEVILGFDLISACAASVVLFSLLRRFLSRTVAEGFQVSPSLSAALLAILTVVNLHWTFYLVRPETVPGVLYVSVSALLLSALASAQTTRFTAVLVTSLILLAICQSFCRTDLSVCLAAGETLFALFFIPGEAKAKRIAFLITGLLSGICGVLIQLYLMKVRYPDAHYCGDMYTLRHNVAPVALIVGGLFLIPFLLGYALLWKRYRSVDSAGRVLMLGAAVHFPIWVSLGNMTETRIYVPFVMALSPWIAVVGARLLSDNEPELLRR